jgi:hypothetical protein
VGWCGSQALAIIFSGKTDTMLWTVAVILTILWALGLLTAHAMGGFIHILVVLAVVAVIVRIVQGRRLL